jgi:hypothetical protein
LREGFALLGAKQRDSNAGAMLRDHAKPRGGAQTKIFDEKF